MVNFIEYAVISGDTKWTFKTSEELKKLINGYGDLITKSLDKNLFYCKVIKHSGEYYRTEYKSTTLNESHFNI